MTRGALVLSLLLIGCGDDEPTDNGSGAGAECSGSSARFATEVVDHAFGSGQDFGQAEFPDPVLGPPSGGGCCQGSLEVTSLGEGGFVTLAFGDTAIVDGDGPDFIVFENAFLVSEDDPESAYAELGSVAVSEDGENFVAFECDGSEFPFEGCAGWHPALANPSDNEIDPLDPSAAGGDAFDLADLGLDEVRYVRIEDLPEEQGGAGTFDLDAVAVVNAACD
jgi:hypothetical protein